MVLLMMKEADITNLDLKINTCQVVKDIAIPM